MPVSKHRRTLNKTQSGLAQALSETTHVPGIGLVDDPLERENLMIGAHDSDPLPAVATASGEAPAERTGT